MNQRSEFIEAVCPNCEAEYSLPAGASGKAVRCRCGKSFDAPSPSITKQSEFPANTVSAVCSCGAKLMAPARFAGKVLSCPKCRTPIPVDEPPLGVSDGVRVDVDESLDRNASRFPIPNVSQDETREPALAESKHIQEFRRAPPQADVRDEIECQYCAELILRMARFCKHCGRDVISDSPESSLTNTGTSTKKIEDSTMSDKNSLRVAVYGSVGLACLMIFVISRAYISEKHRALDRQMKERREMGAEMRELQEIEFDKEMEEIMGPRVRTTSDRPTASRVTLAKFHTVANGMSYAKVVLVLGSKGTLEVDSQVAGIRTQSYRWMNPDGGNLSVMFQNGVSITKAQFGLR